MIRSSRPSHTQRKRARTHAPDSPAPALALAAIALLPRRPTLQQRDHLLVLEHGLVATSALGGLDGEAAELAAPDCDGRREGEERWAQHLVENTCGAGAKLCSVLRVRWEEVPRPEIVHLECRIVRCIAYQVLLGPALHTKEPFITRWNTGEGGGRETAERSAP